MKQAVAMISAIVLLTIIPGSSYSKSVDNSVWGDPVENSDSDYQRWYFSFGTDYRTDERRISDAAPSLLASLMVFTSRSVAINAGLGFNYRTRFDGVHEVRTYLLNLGVRVQDQRRNLSPFLEAGLQFTRYEEKDRDIFRSENRPGIILGIGLSVRVDRTYFLDIKLKQSINYARPENDYDVLALPDDYGSEHSPTWVDGIINQSAFTTSLYNPTTLEVYLRMPF